MHAGAAGVATMPQRRRGGRDAGLFLPGVYRALLEYERLRYESRVGNPVVIDGREIGKKTPAGVGEGFFLYPRRGFLNSLEAGQTVGIGIGRLELALRWRDREQDSPAPRPRLPFGRGVRRVLVSPDDRIAMG